jgi:ribosomal protein RSM22 (predicted rRNA methylase)
MLSLGEAMAQRSTSPAIKSSRWVRADLSGPWQAGASDLVVLSYALGELREEQQEPLVRRLWEVAGGLLIIVEPGTPEGFKRILRMRSLLLACGAALSAPCPHCGPCPMEGCNWCHFSARVARSRLHRQAKGSVLPYEDEKFSYLVAVKVQGQEAITRPARVLRHPQVRKGHIKLELCSADGLKQVTVSKSQGDQYRLAKELKWGSAMLTDKPQA